MKKVAWIFACLLTLAGGCFAQLSTADAARHRTNAQIIEFIVSDGEKLVMGVADAMPAEKYSFAPSAGEFTGVRSFAAQLKHIAADNYLLGAGILGEKPPADTGKGENGSDAIQSKAEIVAYLKESFAYMHRAAASIGDANVPIPTPKISPWPAGTATRLGLAIEDSVHTYDHYGQLVEYLRMNGIIPPASRK
jgi:DinB superfamily